MTAATDVTINTVATGQAPATTAHGGQGGGRAGQARRGQDGDAPAPAGGGRGRGAAPPVGITVAGEVKNYVPVTDAMLRTPEPDDWLMIRRDYHASNYSPLNQITTDNVKDLRLQWVWAMNEGGANQPAPLVHNGVVYLNNPGNVMQAIDGRTGDLIWENRYGTNATGAAMRGIAIYDDKVFTATSDARLVALDAKTGKTVWQTTIGDRSKGNYGTSSGPLLAKGKLIQGLGGCQTYREEKCFISAYDAATGKELWRFNTIAQQGEPGGDSWGRLPNLFRAGGESWITGSYDPVLNLTYWGTAQAKPWMPISRGMSIKDDALYTSSTLALDVDTGKLAWHFQHAPAESLDLDVVFERLLVDDNNQNLVFTVGKDGILWKLDRKTGKYLGHKETVFQNVWERFDPQTGRPSYRSDILEQRFGEWIQGCPSTEGGHNWPASTHHAGTNAAHHSAQPELHRDQRATGRAEGRGRKRRRSGPAFLRDAGLGRQYRQAGRLRRQDHEGDVVLRTAGAVHDRRDLDGRRRRVRRRSRSTVQGLRRQNRRKVLWETRLATSVQGFPVTFSIDGKQYIGVTTGNGGGSPRLVPATIAPELHPPATGNAMYVFALPDRR